MIQMELEYVLGLVMRVGGLGIKCISTAGVPGGQELSRNRVSFLSLGLLDAHLSTLGRHHEF